MSTDGEKIFQLVLLNTKTKTEEILGEYEKHMDAVKAYGEHMSKAIYIDTKLEIREVVK